MTTKKSDATPATPKQADTKKQATPPITGTPKPESTAEAEGAEPSENTGNQPVEVKTETSSSSGE